MGALLTRLRPVSHHVSYERTLQKIDAEQQRVQIVRQRLQARIGHVNYCLWVAALLSVAVAASYAAWIQRQPPGTFNLQQQSLRVLPVFVLPAFFWFLTSSVTACYNWRISRSSLKLKGLEATKRKIIKELKDITRFEKTQQLISQYDPDYQLQTPIAKTKSILAGPPSTPLSIRGVSCPPERKFMQTPTSLLLNAGGAASAAAAAAAGAGRALLPVLQTVANSIVGDNPALLQHVREVQQRVEEAEVKAKAAVAENEALRKENTILQAQLQELEAVQQRLNRTQHAPLHNGIIEELGEQTELIDKSVPTPRLNTLDANLPGAVETLRLCTEDDNLAPTSHPKCAAII